MISVRMHQRGSELLLAAADKELISRKFSEGALRLDVRASFYEGEDASEALLLNRLSICSMANLVGEKTIAIAAREGFIDRDCVIIIDGIPHAQLAKM